MRSTHPPLQTEPTPAHLCQIRSDVKAILVEMQARYEQEDSRFEAAILAAARDVRIAVRVPALCRAVMALPGMSRRKAFHSVALQTGFHVKYVQQLFYGSLK